MKYLLDSDVLIWILRDNKKVINRVVKLSKNEPQAISVISVAEIYKNLLPSESTKTALLFENSFIFSVDYEIAKLGGLFWRDYHPKLKTLNLIDCLIAATVQLNRLTLLSCNTKHFPMLSSKNLTNPLF